MDPIATLHNVYNAAITAIENGRIVTREVEAAISGHLDRQASLEEAERVYLAGDPGNLVPEPRTPTPLSEINANPTPEPPLRRRSAQATRTQKREWRMGGVFDSRGRKIIAQRQDLPSPPNVGPSTRKRGRHDPDSDAENYQSPIRPVKRRAGHKVADIERVMGEDIPGPMTRSRTSGSLRRVVP